MHVSKYTPPDFVPHVLSIAGTDPTGGAGLHADLKSIAAAGGYGMGVVTALVSQNTVGVRAVHTPPLEFLTEQLAAVTEDVEIDAVKIGMLGNRELTELVTGWLRENKPPIVVLDPVMVATSGDRLLDEDALDAMRELVAEATVITPNVPELALLAGVPEATDLSELTEQALDFARDHNVIVIGKTGHLQSSEAGNAVVRPDGRMSFTSTHRIDTKNTHGTGCSLSSALATRMATGECAEGALHWTTRWLNEAIRYADDLHVGKGHGPIDHGHRARRLERAALRGMESIVPHVLPRTDEAGAEAAAAAHAAAGVDGAAGVSGAASAHAADADAGRDGAAAASGASGAPARARLKSFFNQDMGIKPVGPNTEMLWRDIEDIVAEISELVGPDYQFVGDLPHKETEHFLTQEAWYLHRAFPVLSTLATKAKSPQEQITWSAVGQEFLVRSLDLTNEVLGESSNHVAEIKPSTCTQLLLDLHLSNSAFQPYHIAITSMVADLWLVAEMTYQGKNFTEEDSVFADWLEIYGDPSFEDTARQCLMIMEREMTKASEAEVEQIRGLFRRTATLERQAYTQIIYGW